MSANTVKNYRWIIVSLLFFGTTINYLDRQIIGLLKPILEKEFEWTKYASNPIMKENKSSGILVHDGTQYRLYTMHPEVAVHFPDKNE